MGDGLLIRSLQTLKNPRPQLQAALAESGGVGIENGIKKKDESAKKKKKVEKGVRQHLCMAFPWQLQC